MPFDPETFYVARSFDKEGEVESAWVAMNVHKPSAGDLPQGKEGIAFLINSAQRPGMVLPGQIKNDEAWGIEFEEQGPDGKRLWRFEPLSLRTFSLLRDYIYAYEDVVADLSSDGDLLTFFEEEYGRGAG